MNEASLTVLSIMLYIHTLVRTENKMIIDILGKVINNIDLTDDDRNIINSNNQYRVLFRHIMNGIKKASIDDMELYKLYYTSVVEMVSSGKGK